MICLMLVISMGTCCLVFHSTEEIKGRPPLNGRNIRNSKSDDRHLGGFKEPNVRPTNGNKETRNIRLASVLKSKQPYNLYPTCLDCYRRNTYVCLEQTNRSPKLCLLGVTLIPDDLVEDSSLSYMKSPIIGDLKMLVEFNRCTFALKMEDQGDFNEVSHNKKGLGRFIMKRAPMLFITSSLCWAIDLHPWKDIRLLGLSNRPENELSKWKIKNLQLVDVLRSIQVCPYVLDFYNMSLYKAPLGVLRDLEFLRRNFFNGADINEKRFSMISWNKILASKQKGAILSSRLIAWFYMHIVPLVHTGSGFSLSPWEICILKELSLCPHNKKPVEGWEEEPLHHLVDLLGYIFISFHDDGEHGFCELRWVKVVPIKVNILAWKVCLDKSQRILNLNCRGIDIPSIICPNCGLAGESSRVFSTLVVGYYLIKRDSSLLDMCCVATVLELLGTIDTGVAFSALRSQICGNVGCNSELVIKLRLDDIVFDDEIQALVQKQIDEDMVRQKAILDLALQFDNACTVKDDLRKAYEKSTNLNNENDQWELSLDIDDFDLRSTPVMCPSSSTRVETSPSTQRSVRIIPDPAGIVQLAKLRKQKDVQLGLDGAVMSTQEYMKKDIEDVGEDENFKSGSWVSTTDYVNANGGTMSGCLRDIKNFLKNEKLDQVVAIVKSCSPNVIDDLTVTMKDLSSTIPETIHHKVIGKGGYGKDITV
ncbi:hypothetical protein Tco_0484988 [Tanacetum coccineum]